MKDLPILPRVVLHPGDHYVTNKEMLLTTLLGSCVAVCLYDPVARIAGMNHFMLVNRRYARNMPLNITDAGRYGVHSMELLINDMMRMGAQKARLKAKAFGGGAVLDGVSNDNFMCVGDVNERFIRDFLKTENIEMVAEDLGGKEGRVIRFRTDNYAVFRKYIVKGATMKLEKKERGYWQKSIEETEHETDKVFLFS